MTVWIVLLGILLFLVFLLFLPVSLCISFEEEIKGRIKFCFFTVFVFSGKQKQSLKKKRKPTVEKEKNSALNVSNLIKQRGLFGFLKIMLQIGKLGEETAKKIFSHFIIKDLKLKIRVSGEDAAKTAIIYGQVCSSVYPAMSILLSHAKYQNYEIQITPEFAAQKSEVHFFISGKIKLCFILSIFGYALWQGVKIYRSLKTDNLTKQKEF